RSSLLGQGQRHSDLIRESVIFGTFISSCRRKWFVMKQKVVFIGAGSMAEAIIAGLVQAQFFPNEYIFIKQKNVISLLVILQKKYKIQSFNDKEVVRDDDFVVLATKTVDVKEEIKSVQSYINSNQLIISVLAGLETSHI